MAQPDVSAPMPRYVAAWLTCLLALAGAVVGLNVFVDPYGLIGTPRITGVNADKPAAADWPRLAKPYLIDRAAPATVVIGASTVDIGFDPESAAWPPALRPVFNLGIDGADPPSQFRYLQHALTASRPKLIVIGVAFEDSLRLPEKPLSADERARYEFEQRLRVQRDGAPNPGYALARIKDYAFATVSIRALQDSLTTLVRQGSVERSYETARGFNSGGDLRRWTAQEGSRALVANKLSAKAQDFLSWSRTGDTSIDGVSEMIDAARAAGAQVILCMTPAYVDELELYRQLGMDDLFLRWKAGMTALAARKAAADGGVVLWDFTGYTPYTTEEMPASAGPNAHLRWSWETVHFRSELGNAMIARMTGTGGPADLGAVLTPEALPEDAAAFRAAQRAWVTSHPEDVALVASIVAAARRDLCAADASTCTVPLAKLSQNAR